MITQYLKPKSKEEILCLINELCFSYYDFLEENKVSKRDIVKFNKVLNLIECSSENAVLIYNLTLCEKIKQLINSDIQSKNEVKLVFKNISIFSIIVVHRNLNIATCFFNYSLRFLLDKNKIKNLFLENNLVF